jgi:hypothetical protein
VQELRYLIGLLAALVALSTSAAPLSVRTASLRARFDLGTLTDLSDRHGRRYVGGNAMAPTGVTIHRLGAEHAAQAGGGPLVLDAEGRARCRYESLRDLPGGVIEGDLARVDATGEVTAAFHGQSPEPGVAGVEWSVGPIPAEMNLIVPGWGGFRLTATSPVTAADLEYPMAWEAQLVIVEGQGRGFYVWADDTTGRYKRLRIRLKPDGWWLGFTTWNNAPFDDLTECQSVNWRIGVYEGDWRVPARRYREWAQANLPPVTDRQPAWVRDIRSVVILFSAPEAAILDTLAQRVAPRQTLVYVPNWRPDGYDRLYPNYEGVASFGPFVTHAHELGFRVMPHLNYFACDPQHPLYEQLKAYHVRDPWGTHEQQWFTWDDSSDPTNNRKLAYINPAYRPWRDLLIERIGKLQQTYGVDAVYLDQTLNIYNDHNGLCDGVTMLQGNLALGRELRAALPGLAVGGESLNEVTARYQDFCQRHAYGIDFDRSTWNKAQLKDAHPISSYLFQPTIMFHYIGCPPPATDQYYAAWREDYTRWGVLPTLMVFGAETKPPTGFGRQLAAEIRFWQTERLVPDLEGPWPADVLFPYRTADGQRAVRTADGRFTCGKREISRTVTGVSELRLAGTIEGALCYDRKRIFGLNPDLWYPAFPEPRDLTAFHVESLPAGVSLQTSTLRDGFATLTARAEVLAYLPRLLAQATCGSRPFVGDPLEVRGALQGADGSQFAGLGDQIHAHPPWKPGTGIAYARWCIRLPRHGGPRFVSEVALDPGAAGTSDGVRFGVTAWHGRRTAHAEAHNATAERRPLDLDLAAFAGQEIELELTVDPGPARDVTADWARWFGPRVVDAAVTSGRLAIIDPARNAALLSGTQASTPGYRGTRSVVEVSFPGTLILLRDTPASVVLPVDLASTPFRVGFSDASGQVLTAPAWADAVVGLGKVGGVERRSLRVQPPDLGRTSVTYALFLPPPPAAVRCFVGIEDGSRSTGVEVIVQANGIELARQRLLPGAPWCELTADLSPWAGKPVVLALVTDAAGPYGSDWARWGEPQLLPK